MYTRLRDTKYAQYKRFRRKFAVCGNVKRLSRKCENKRASDTFSRAFVLVGVPYSFHDTFSLFAKPNQTTQTCIQFEKKKV